MGAMKSSEARQRAQLDKAAIDKQAKSSQITTIVIMIIVGLLTLYFARGIDGLLNSRP